MSNVTEVLWKAAQARNTKVTVENEQLKEEIRILRNTVASALDLIEKHKYLLKRVTESIQENRSATHVNTRGCDES